MTITPEEISNLMREKEKNTDLVAMFNRVQECIDVDAMKKYTLLSKTWRL